MNMLRSLFGIPNKPTVADLLKDDAIIVDVRTPEEYREGHVAGSLNIPLDRLKAELNNLDKKRPIVTCCRSGARSATAAGLLVSSGFMAHNGGPWVNVQKHLLRS